MTGRKISVLIVDDSAVVRQVLTEMLSADRGIEVMGAAPDPIFAMKKMEARWPDVIVLDIEMPRMDGLTFLRKIMSERPTPVVICSTLTQKGAETTMQAMSAGAVSIITKPRAGLKGFLQDSANDVATAVKAAAKARMSKVSASASAPVETAHVAPVRGSMLKTTQQLVAIGTSTGGTQALEVVLRALPALCPGIVIVQHMPEKFTDMFAQRLNSLCKIQVREARDRDRVLPGTALIAPGGRHMKIERSGAHYITRVFDGPPVNRHKPSVDVLFRSVADQAGKNAVGFILTGMGGDGARGLKAMHDAGAHTVAQDEKSSIVFGMPKEAIALGAADKVIGLGEVAREIMGSATADHL
ncbi:protein-glutamate methylesterase/protein-glutamine glutaminase [Wenzhouxiangella limi]|uniref:Protein-glutamate methylesterase/protein-glutamine glutaminase n=1 Tax=Wenzhouxiangella limi TaxID=2707351 RepID=A0A845V264_9GAMM|nr:chemotaxis response regulator protein-glutamate methylesterase [Wenzhouxiangella limi]NDY95346.1 chemotaxis response regulator protein-glutamate methylesterase [Wenzhouxiangella limi]